MYRTRIPGFSRFSIPAVGLALVVIAAVGSLAFAGLVPGKGKSKTNCYVEYDITGITNPSDRVQQNGGQVLCTDGEACDTDGV